VTGGRLDEGEAIRRVVDDVAEQARAAGRSPESVTIVAVTKTLPPAAVEAAWSAGLRHVGENYVQEARDKRRSSRAPMTWHMIGTLQRNKVRAAARIFDCVQSLEDQSVAEALDDAAHATGKRLSVLLQVDVGEHPAGRGIRPELVRETVRAVASCRALDLDGFMCLAPPRRPASEIRIAFRRLRELRDDARAAVGLELPHLSMGMTDDYAIAIEEGSTMLRLGRALFGARGTVPWRETT